MNVPLRRGAGGRAELRAGERTKHAEKAGRAGGDNGARGVRASVRASVSECEPGPAPPPAPTRCRREGATDSVCEPGAGGEGRRGFAAFFFFFAFAFFFFPFLPRV